VAGLKTRPSPSRLVASILWIFFAVLYLGPTASNPASAFDLGSLFKREKLDAREIPVNLKEAVRILTNYRARHGLGPVKLDPKLTRIAADHAIRMAADNKVAHVLRGEGSFARRLRAGGYEASVASENIGAGYDDLAEAFAGWRNSPDHNKNMLRPDMTVMGIASASAAGSKYGTYWSLVLAHPYEGPAGFIPGQ
jgi:uncharacterized protein YkwD